MEIREEKTDQREDQEKQMAEMEQWRKECLRKMEEGEDCKCGWKETAQEEDGEGDE